MLQGPLLRSITNLFISGVEVVRSYTVVDPSLSEDTTDSRLREGTIIYLMIKIYSDGALTPWIGSLKTGIVTFQIS